MKSWRSGKKEAQTQLLEEAPFLKKLANYKHFVRLIITYARGNALGLVMEPVATCDLNDLIEARPKNRAWAIPILQKAPGCLTSALADIHALKIRHKDISPRNILICPDNVLLTDFGLSRDVSELTRTDTSGPTARTLNYCSPEVALHESRGRKSDVFSLGCVILVILGLLPQNGAAWLEDVLAFCPFYSHLDLVDTWIQDKTKTSEDAATKAWLRNCSQILREEADQRPTMQEAIEDMLSDPSLEESFPLLFCNDCLEQKNTLDLTTIRNQRKVSAEKSKRNNTSRLDVDTLGALDDEVIAESVLPANTNLASYLLLPNRLSQQLYAQMKKRRIPSNITGESLTEMLLGRLIVDCFIPECGIHPQVINANARLYNPSTYSVMKDLKQVQGFARAIPGYQIISGVAQPLSPRDVQDMFEDTAKWYWENGKKFNRPYLASETYQQRQIRGPGPQPKSKGELEWMASNLKDWQDRMLQLPEQVQVSPKQIQESECRTKAEEIWTRFHPQESLVEELHRISDFSLAKKELLSQKVLKVFGTLQLKGAFGASKWMREVFEQNVMRIMADFSKKQLHGLREIQRLLCIWTNLQSQLESSGGYFEADVESLICAYRLLADFVEEWGERLLGAYDPTSGRDSLKENLKRMIGEKASLMQQLGDRRRGLEERLRPWTMKENPLLTPAGQTRSWIEEGTLPISIQQIRPCNIPQLQPSDVREDPLITSAREQRQLTETE